MPATTLPGDVKAHLAVPPVGAGPWPGVVVLHESFGLNDDIRQQADRLAAAGYLALAPDLFSAGGAWRCIRATFAALTRGHGKAFDDIEAARAWLTRRVSGRRQLRGEGQDAARDGGEAERRARARGRRARRPRVPGCGPLVPQPARPRTGRGAAARGRHRLSRAVGGGRLGAHPALLRSTSAVLTVSVRGAPGRSPLWMDARTHARSLGPWPALAATAAVVAVVAMAAAAWGLVDPGLSWNAAFTAAAACALSGTLAARRGSVPEHRYRWGCWAAAAGCWLAGQIAWDVFSEIGFPRAPNVADLCWYLFALLVAAGLLRSPAGSRGERAVALVESLPLIAAVSALTFAELWEHGGGAGLSLAERLSALAYPALYVSAAVLTLQVMVGGSLRQVRGPGPRLVLLGIVLQAVAFIFWSEELLHQSYVMGATLIDPLWVAGLLAIGAGGVLAGGRPEPPVVADEMSRRGGILPAATFALLIAALVHMGFEQESPPLGAQLMLAAGALVSGGTMIVRTVLLERRLGGLLAFEREAREELAGREAELARLNARLLEDSRRDPLTGLRNRRALVEDLPDVELDARRHGQSFALAICDVDRFKAYNDRLGHIAGDQALRTIAATVRMQLRAGDAAYRYGGEELVLILRDTDAREALAAAERVRAAVESAALPHPDDPRGVVTVSIGVATGKGDAPELLARADRALYDAKHGGRNGVRAAEGEGTPKPARRRTDTAEQPLLRHLRGLLGISRAAASGRGPMPVLESMAELLRTALGFQTLAVNLREGHDDDLRVVLVAGDEEARAALLGNVNPWATWHPLLDPKHDRLGASWLPAGSHDWAPDHNVYTPESARSLGPDAWDPDDALLLPLRGATGEVLGVVS